MDNYQEILKKMIMNAHQKDGDITEQWIDEYIKENNLNNLDIEKLIKDFKWNVIVK